MLGGGRELERFVKVRFYIFIGFGNWAVIGVFRKFIVIWIN